MKGYTGIIIIFVSFFVASLCTNVGIDAVGGIEHSHEVQNLSFSFETGKTYELYGRTETQTTTRGETRSRILSGGIKLICTGVTEEGNFLMDFINVYRRTELPPKKGSADPMIVDTRTGPFEEMKRRDPASIAMGIPLKIEFNTLGQVVQLIDSPELTSVIEEYKKINAKLLPTGAVFEDHQVKNVYFDAVSGVISSTFGFYPGEKKRPITKVGESWEAEKDDGHGLKIKQGWVLESIEEETLKLAITGSSDSLSGSSSTSGTFILDKKSKWPVEGAFNLLSTQRQPVPKEYATRENVDLKEVMINSSTVYRFASQPLD